MVYHLYLNYFRKVPKTTKTFCRKLAVQRYMSISVSYCPMNDVNKIENYYVLMTCKSSTLKEAFLSFCECKSKQSLSLDKTISVMNNNQLKSKPMGDIFWKLSHYDFFRPFFLAIHSVYFGLVFTYSSYIIEVTLCKTFSQN